MRLHPSMRMGLRGQMTLGLRPKRLPGLGGTPFSFNAVQGIGGIAPQDGINAIYNGPWGAGELVAGVDYDVQTHYNTSRLNGRVAIDWWINGLDAASPKIGAPLGYFFRSQYNYRALPLAVERRYWRVRELTAFEETFAWSYTGSDEFNLLSESFLTKEPALSHNSFPEIVGELGFFYHMPQATKHWHNGLRPNGVTAIPSTDYYRLPDWVDPQGRTWSVSWHVYNNYFNFALGDEAEDIFSGTIDKRAALLWLIEQGTNPRTGLPFVSPEWFINGPAIGIEPTFAAENTAGTVELTQFSTVFEGVSRPMRVVPNGPNNAFLVVSHAELGVIAYELTYQNGGDTSTPSASIGGNFGGWRWTGTHHLADFEDDPTSPLATLHDDIGSTDSAMQGNYGTSLFGGHYHGGIVLTSSSVPDLTIARDLTSFDFGYTGTITWPTGETATVTYTLTVQSNGDLSGSISYTSTAVFTRVFLSMVIANGFTHFSIDDGETWTDAQAAATYSFADTSEILLRQGPTGNQIKVNGDIRGREPSRLTTEVVNNGNRLKDYVRVTSGGAPLGTVSMTRTISFGKTAPDVVTNFPIVDTYDGTGAVPTGYTQTNNNGGSSTSTQEGGFWKLRVGASPPATNGAFRFVRPLTNATQDGVKIYRLEVDYQSIQSNTGAVVFLTRDGSGSTASGNQLPFVGGATSINLNSPIPTTVSMTFVLPADAPAPHLTFQGMMIAGRGVDISEVRVIEV